MSPAEYIELFQNGGANTGMHAMNFVTLIFAYIVAVYFVATKLNQFQVWAVSLIYSIFACFPAFSAVGSLGRTITLAKEFVRQHPEVAEKYIDLQVLEFFQPVYLGLVFLVAWLLSILFMISERFGPRGI